MSGDLEVRRATAEDAGGIARVRVRGWQAGYRGLMDQDYLDSLSVEANTKRTRSWDWDSGKTRSWVCTANDEIVGWTTVFLRARDEDLPESVGEIAACYALPETWGTGVGHRMIDVSIADLRSTGVGSIVLWVLERNARARAFYRRQGFTLDGSQKTESFEPMSGLLSVRMRMGI